MRIAPCLFALVLAMTRTAAAAELTVTVTGAGPTGQIRGMLFRDAASFDKKSDPVASFALMPRNGSVTASIADLPPGHYAVAVFQDTNGNHRLDTNVLGIPTEPYGFSNDAAGVTGPPTFDNAKFTVGTSSAAITIRLR